MIKFSHGDRPALGLAGLRQRYPAATEDELWLRLAVRRLGAAVVQRVTGWSGGDP